ncbi:MAG: flagellar hook-basal body complex protein FliE [Candidatus Acidiferrales bacterium]
MVTPVNSFSAISDVAQIPQGAGANLPSDGADFSQTLDGVMNQVEGMQGDAQTKVQELLQGNGQDIHSAMIAVQKADLSFQLMMQVRNKIIQAYQTVSQMQF